MATISFMRRPAFARGHAPAAARERRDVRRHQDRAIAAGVGLLAVLGDVEPDAFLTPGRTQRHHEANELQDARTSRRRCRRAR